MSERQENEGREQAVGVARRDAEEQATDEILAMEQDLERERVRVVRSLDAVQRRLEEEAEARAASKASVADARAASANRERQLIAERDEATVSLREAQEQLARLERDAQEERAGEGARRSERERELLEQSRAELEAQVRRELEGEFAQRISRIKSEADARTDEEVAAVRRAGQDAAERAQRRLDEVTEQIEAAGARVEAAEAKLVEERGRIERQAEERIDTEMRRLQAESDAKIQEALASVETETKSGAREEMERELAGLRDQIEQVEAARREEAEKHKAEMRRVAVSAERKQPESEQTVEQEAVGPAEPGFLQRVAETRRAKREEKDAKRAAEQPSPKPEPSPEPEPSKPSSRAEGSEIDVNLATFEELRGLGFSVTQATRVIAYRERNHGFDSVDELHAVPGLPNEGLDELKEKLRV